MVPRLRVLAITTALTAGVACTPEPVTDDGDAISGLYDFFFTVAVVIFVLVAGLIAWNILRYRAEEDDDELPSQFHTNVPLEILWFAIPTAIVIVLFVLSVGVLNDVNEEDDSGVTVDVEGFQWGWTFTYEEGFSLESLPEQPIEVRLPVGEPITFNLVSPDVVHSFYVPRFLLKRDVVPGQENRIDLTIDEPGLYRAVCAEFCGLLHHRMIVFIRAVEPERYERWIERNAEEAGVDVDG
ncbi:MAG TPA: cytochrome c oxidase subunit II [Actinomycetota bacterium]|nr:cytochrome c oxidase subunit II [Actinomycetota bacterium]